MKNNPLISIVVPVYNVEDYLEDCVASLTGQTYPNLEIILVDDGSPDASGQMCDRLAATDERIKVFHTENQGLPAARNEGMKHATGDIMMFVDSDDTIVAHACEKVANVFTETDAEVYTFGFLCHPPEATPFGMEKEMRPASKVFDGFTPDLLFKEKSRPYAWRTACSREFLETYNLRFAPGFTLGEDQIFYFRIYPFSKKTVLSPDQLYVYRMREASMTHADAKDRGEDEAKTEKHMGVIEQILSDWAAFGLQDLCPSELEEWMLDFVLFDIRLLEPPKRYAYFKRLMDDFRQFFGQEPSAVAQHAATRKCLEDIERTLAKVGENPQTYPDQYVAIPNFVQFYLMRYGFVRCFQQVLISLGLIKKWK